MTPKQSITDGVTAEEYDRWPRYKSHKVVRAMRIVGMERLTVDDAEYVVLELKNGQQIVFTDRWWVNRNPGQLGTGYLVAYADGYVSWSPTDAFEEGYTDYDGTAEEPNS